ncbi:MAG: hypothetical protein ACI4KR_04450, partial [Ruminiclostridium sp.]
MKGKKCTKCKMEIDRRATKCPHCGSSQGMSCSGMLGAGGFVIGVIFLLGMCGRPKEDKSNQNMPVATT